MVRILLAALLALAVFTLHAQEVPLAEVAEQAEKLATELRAAANEIATDPTAERATGTLNLLALEIDARDEELARLVRGEAPLAALRAAAAGWQRHRDALAMARRDLGTQAARIDKHVARLAELEKQWSATAAAFSAADAPAAARERARATIETIKQARTDIDRGAAQVLGLLDRVAKLDARVTAALAAIDTARVQAVGQLFARQAPPLLTGAVAAAPAAEAPFDASVAELRRYAHDERERLALHAALVIALAVLLFAVKRRVPDAPIFDSPIAAALVLAVFASGWLHPEAPRLAWMILGAIALVGTVFVLRRVVERRLLPILDSVLVFYLADQVRPFLVGSLERWLFILEMLAGSLVALAVARAVARAGNGRIARWTARGARLVVGIFLAAAFANALGFTSLGDTLARGVLEAAYSGVIVYAAVLIVDALVRIALASRALARLHVLEAARERVLRWLYAAVRFAGLAFWIWLALGRLGLRDRVASGLKDALAAELPLGALGISVAEILGFVLAIVLALAASRLVRFMFETDVATRVNLPPGIPYAISRSLHYAILAIGLMVALAALGVDMTRFTILVGALTVGIGFGLQNIINNFVSGLIMLFERPVRVGDVIQMEDQTGVVERIGIRASVIRSASGADIILPNGKFISDRVTNWTRSTGVRPIEIPLALPPGINARQALELLERLACEQDGVVCHPAPEALIVRSGAEGLGVELHVWTDRANDWARVRSEVTLAATEALATLKPPAGGC